MINFPTWLAFALTSPFFWGITHVLDSYCVDEVFDHPWIGAITSGLCTLLALPFLTLGLFFVPTAPMALYVVGLCILAGLVFMAGQIAYFYALSFSESGIIAAYWNLIPLLLLVIGYLFFDEHLTQYQYLGCTLLIVSSVGFCLLDGNAKSRWQSFCLMLFGVLCMSVYFLVQKKAFTFSPVYQVFLVSSLSIASAGLTPLLSPRHFRVFRQNWGRIRPAFGFLLAIEVANLIALGTSQYAVSYGYPSLVSAVEGTIPAYAFVISMVLYAVFRKFGEEEAHHHLLSKLLLVGVMAFGVWLVS